MFIFRKGFIFATDAGLYIRSILISRIWRMNWPGQQIIGRRVRCFCRLDGCQWDERIVIAAGGIIQQTSLENGECSGRYFREWDPPRSGY